MQFQRGHVGQFFKGDPTLGAWLPFDEGGPVDFSGNGNNGTLQGGVSKNQGKIGDGLYFDGVDDYVSTTTQYNNPQTFSLLVWFKTSVASGKKIIGFENSQTGTGAPSYDRHLYVGTDGKLYFGIWDGAVKTVSTTGTVNDGNWHLAIGTFGSNTLKLYLDGALIGSLSTGAAVNYNGWWRIGSYESWITDGYFPGYIDEPSVFMRELSPKEISDYYLWSIGTPPRRILYAPPTPTENGEFTITSQFTQENHPNFIEYLNFLMNTNFTQENYFKFTENGEFNIISQFSDKSRKDYAAENVVKSLTTDEGRAGINILFD